MTKVVAIVGPTAVGKTALALKLATDLNGEVISGDSMQVYRGLDIGTAKATEEEQAVVPHHLIDVREVTEGYSVADFQRAANRAIDSISGRGKLPLVVGGTGLYVQALVDNLNLGEGGAVAGDPVIRERWARLAEERGPAVVWAELNRQDPAAAARIPVGNLRRAIRALEVIERTGRPFSSQPKRPARDDFFLIGLTTARPVLYQRIRSRDQFDRGHILGARSLPYPILRQQGSDLRPDLPVYLYDEGMTLSTQAAVHLAKQGFKQIYILKDGYVQWTGKTKKAKYID